MQIADLADTLMDVLGPGPTESMEDVRGEGKTSSACEVSPPCDVLMEGSPPQPNTGLLHQITGHVGHAARREQLRSSISEGHSGSMLPSFSCLAMLASLESDASGISSKMLLPEDFHSRFVSNISLETRSNFGISNAVIIGAFLLASIVALAVLPIHDGYLTPDAVCNFKSSRVIFPLKALSKAR